MYKKRITKWQLFKNYKAAEKEQIVRSLEDNGHFDLEHHQLTIRGLPIKMHRIDRYRRERNQGSIAGLDSTNLFEEESITRSDFTENRRTQTLMRHLDARAEKRAQFRRRLINIADPKSHVSDLPEHQDTTKLLWQIEYYFSWKLGDNPTVAWNAWKKSSVASRPSEPISYIFQGEGFHCVYNNPTDIFNRFGSAQMCLQRNAYRPAWKMINEAAAMVRACLQQEDPLLLQRLWSSILNESASTDSEIATHLLQLLFNMATIVCGRLHPITIICELLSTSQRRKYIAKLAEEKFVDMLGCSLKENHVNVLTARFETQCSLRDQGEDYEMERSARNVIEISERFRGRDDFTTRHALYKLATCIYANGRYSEAERIVVDTIERGKAAGDCDRVNILANFLMSNIYFERKDYTAAEVPIWRALFGSLWSCGLYGPVTMLVWQQYKILQSERDDVRETIEVERQYLHSLDDRVEHAPWSNTSSRVRSSSVDSLRDSERGRSLKSARRSKRRERGKSCSFFDLRAY